MTDRVDGVELRRRRPGTGRGGGGGDRDAGSATGADARRATGRRSPTGRRWNGPVGGGAGRRSLPPSAGVGSSPTAPSGGSIPRAASSSHSRSSWSFISLRPAVTASRIRSPASPAARLAERPTSATRASGWSRAGASCTVRRTRRSAQREEPAPRATPVTSQNVRLATGQRPRRPDPGLPPSHYPNRSRPPCSGRHPCRRRRGPGPGPGPGPGCVRWPSTGPELADAAGGAGPEGQDLDHRVGERPIGQPGGRVDRRVHRLGGLEDGVDPLHLGSGLIDHPVGVRHQRHRLALELVHHRRQVGDLPTEAATATSRPTTARRQAPAATSTAISPADMIAAA